MSKVLNCLSTLALVLTVSACGSPNEPVNEVVANDMGTVTPEAGPFGDAKSRMDAAMTAAVGVNAADNWVRKMIEHHRGAVDMSRIALAGGVTGDVAKMAQMTIDKQGKEITTLEKLVATGSPNPVTAELYKPASITMNTAMMGAKGADLSETYLRKMLAHHQGAVTMSDVALANGATGVVRAQVEKTKADQQMEVAMVEAMLRGEPMMGMTAVPVKVEAAKAPAKAAPAAAAAKPVAAKTPLKPSTPKPAVDPHAGHDMNNM